MNDAHLFAAARKAMLKADYTGGNKVRIGCVAVYKGTILAKGCNTDRTHTYQAYYNKWRYKDSGNKYLPEKLHAELSVLQRIKFLDIDFSKVHLYIYREMKDGRQAMSRCCPSCLAAAKACGIKHLHYTSPDGFIHEVLKYD